MIRARRPRGVARLVLALAVVFAVLGYLVIRSTSPAKVTESTVPAPVARASLIEVSADGALVRPPSGPDRMVGPDGSVRWTADGARAGRLGCLVCPAALRVGERLARIDGEGTVSEATDLDGRLQVADISVRVEGDELSVWIPTASGHVDAGRISAQSLDARRYALAPAVAVGADRRTVTAVVGLDDTREVGRVRVAFLRAGRTPVERVVDLARAGQAPSPCRPAPGTDRWGWLTTAATGEPGQGTASLQVAVDSRLGPVRKLDNPYTSCVVTDGGYVLTSTPSTPAGTTSAIAWLDPTGRVIREITRTGTDSRALTSVSTAGSVVVPSGAGFDLLAPDGSRRHLDVQDAALAATGELWVVRKDEVRRVADG